MTELKLIVFDCDGTLVDGQYMILEAMRRACHKLATEMPNDNDVRRIVGLSLPEAIRRLFPLKDHALHMEIDHAFRSSYQDMRHEDSHEEPLFDGVHEVLQDLNNQGYLLAVATGKSRKGLDNTLRLQGLEDMFVATRTADDGPGKPHPQMIADIMNITGVNPAATAMVGDTSFDIQMARAAAVHAVGVSWGYHDFEDLQQTGAHHILGHMRELPPLVETLL